MNTQPLSIEKLIELSLSVNEMTERNLCEVLNRKHTIVRPALMRLETAGTIEAVVREGVLFYRIKDAG